MQIASENIPSAALLNKLAPLSPINGCESLKAHIAPDVFGMWHSWEKETGKEQEIPYWAVVWPGAAILAQYLLDNSESLVKGKKVLDLGCGGAIPAIAAFKAGASKIIANDIDPVALHIADLNAKANRAEITFDSHNFIMQEGIEPFDLVLVGDLFYEKSTAGPIMTLLKKLKQYGAHVLIADGERKYAPRTDVHIIFEKKIKVNFELEGIKERKVQLMSLV